MALLAVLTTVANRDQAQRLAQAMVERRLAACAQINPIDSVYRWQGEVRQESEQRVLFKTTEAAYPALQAALLEQHPYELPQIVAFTLSPVFEPYAQWVAEQTGDPR